MKYILIILLFSLSNSYGQPPAKLSINDIAQMEKKNFINTFNLSHTSSASDNFDVKYYRCEWETDPAVRYLKGCVTSYFTMLQSGSTIVYDLRDNLKVDSIIFQSQKIAFQRGNDAISIHLGQTLPAGKLDSVKIFYQGIPISDGFGSFINSSHNGTPIVWTLSEPFGSRDWWPCKNNASDKADSMDIWITSPKEYKAASNGLRQGEWIVGDQKITHWKHRYPISSYLVCMAITNFIEMEEYVPLGSRNLLMQTFCYPENQNLFKTHTPLVIQTLQYFNDLLGEFPFINEKYGHVQFGWGGGMEHQTATFLYSPDESLMSHELAHQWFGDKITLKSWQDIWLNEGFASYFASIDLEKKYPQTAILGRKNEIAHITSLPGGSVFVKDTTNVNRIFDGRLSYTKGSHLLYMLRWILGDDLFMKGIRNYLNDSHLAYGNATSIDFQRHMEKVSGVDLNYFFEQWLYGEGYPTFHVEWTPIGKSKVMIKVDQKASHPSVNFFKIPVALKFQNATQQKTIVVQNDFNQQNYLEDIGFIADTVIIDPEYWLISGKNTSVKVPDDTPPNRINLFPNPVQNILDIQLLHFDAPKVTLQIFDISGKMISKETVQIDGYYFKKQDMSLLPKGIYILRCTDANGVVQSHKIIKQ